MTDMNALVDRYIAAWNEPDAAARRTAVAQVWTVDGSYTDPLADAAGADDISALIGGAQAQFPGFVFARLGDVDAHHGIARFRWQLLPAAGGDSLVEGSDVATMADGRLQAVYGFLDKVPARAS